MRTDATFPRRNPAVRLAALCLLAALLLSPPLLERIVSLDWKIGDMRPIAAAGQTLFAAAGLLAWVGRCRVNPWLRRHVPSRRHFALGVATWTVSSVLSLLALELALRVWKDPLRPLWAPPEYHRAQYDSVSGWSYISNQSVMQSFVKGLPPVPVHTDENGIRVPTADTRLDPQRPSILFVGCSFTMGYGLAYEDTFIGQLAAQPGLPYQLVNLGVEAYGTDQAWLRLQRYLRDFQTAAVVYTFLPAHVDRNRLNDLRIVHRGVRMVGTKPLYGLRRNGSLYLKRAPCRLEDYHYWRLWALLQRTWHERGPKKRDLKLSRALLEAMGREAQAAGAAFILVHWDFWGDGSETRPMLADTGFPVVDLCAEHPSGWRDMRLPRDSHPNAQACAYAAERLLIQLKALGLITE
jgi:hypothetical protein